MIKIWNINSFNDFKNGMNNKDFVDWMRESKLNYLINEFFKVFTYDIDVKFQVDIRNELNQVIICKIGEFNSITLTSSYYLILTTFYTGKCFTFVTTPAPVDKEKLFLNFIVKNMFSGIVDQPLSIERNIVELIYAGNLELANQLIIGLKNKL